MSLEFAGFHGNNYVTLPNVVTASRAPLANEIRERLVDGETGVTVLMAAWMASDAEGQIARFMDKHLPELKLGSSEFGKMADPIMDSATMLWVADGIMRSKRVMKRAKLATSSILAVESKKIGWAAKANLDHILNNGEQLVLSPHQDGKNATVAKMAEMLCATATHDLEDGASRKFFGNLAVSMAGAAIYFGERSRKRYDQDLKSRQGYTQ